MFYEVKASRSNCLVGSKSYSKYEYFNYCGNVPSGRFSICHEVPLGVSFLKYNTSYINSLYLILLEIC